MRVLLLGECSFLINEKGEQYYAGGTEKMSDYIIRSLQDHYELYYLYHHGQTDSTERYKEFYPGLKDVKRIPKASKNLFKYIEDNKIDFVLVSSWMSLTIQRCIKEVISYAGVKAIVYNHGIACCHIKDYGENLLDKDYVHIINCTENEENVCRDYGISDSRMHRILNPVELPDNFVVPKENELNDKFAMSARIVEGKGIENGLDLCNKIGKTLDIIGKRQSNGLYNKLVRKYGDINNIGPFPREELFEILSKYQLAILLPTLQEGMSLSTIEANSLGVPVIAWNDSINRQSLINDYNIFLDQNIDFVKQFEEEYLPHLDKYLDYNFRKELSEKTIERCGLTSYGNNLIKIIDEVYNS